MCELFGVSSDTKIQVNSLLKEFYSHSVNHPNGWGFAVFYENSVSLEKEPIQASKSSYLKERLRHRIEGKNMIAHIRYATIGTMDYENCHPFVKRDNFGRSWTLAHNGTIFDYQRINPYLYSQEGKTDSERILLYLVDQINTEQMKRKRGLYAQERFELLDGLLCDMAKGNKLNLLIYDGEFMYIHSNYKNSLYINQLRETAIFATVPLNANHWDPVPFTTLCAYKDGKKQFQGNAHGNEYLENEQDMKLLFVDFAGL